MFVKLLQDTKRRPSQSQMDEENAIIVDRPVDGYLRQWGLEMYITKFKGKYQYVPIPTVSIT